MKNISLHIRKLPPATGGGGYSEVKYSKCQDLPKFQFGAGGVLKVNTQSAKICLNFNFLAGDGGSILKANSQSAKICLNFNWGVF